MLRFKLEPANHIHYLRDVYEECKRLFSEEECEELSENLKKAVQLEEKWNIVFPQTYGGMQDAMKELSEATDLSLKCMRETLEAVKKLDLANKFSVTGFQNLHKIQNNKIFFERTIPSIPSEGLGR